MVKINALHLFIVEDLRLPSESNVFAGHTGY